MTGVLEASALLLTLFLFSLISHRLKSLDRNGIIIGNAVGIAVYLLGGLQSFFLMVFFFIIAEASTKIGRMKTEEKHEVRTTGNILGNSSAALIALFLGSVPGFYGAVSAALADTLSSEIGLTSKKKPLLITTLKEVEAGTNGGITSKGMWAAALGALSIALIQFYFSRSIGLFFVVTIAGIIGSVFDSLIGALFERKGMLGNTGVNFLGSLSGAIFAHSASVIFSF